MNRIYRRIWCTARQCWVVASELAAARGKRAAGPRALASVLLMLLGTPLLSVASERGSENEDGEAPLEIVGNDLGAPATQLAMQEAMRSAAHAGYESRAGVMGQMPRANRSTLGSGYAMFNESCSGELGGTYYRCTPSFGSVDDYVHSVVAPSSRNVLFTGVGMNASGKFSTAFGHSINIYGDFSTVFGYGAQSWQGYSTVIGATAIGDGVGTTVLGNDARAYSENSIAVGSGSRTVNSSGGNSRIAIGGNAFAGTAGYTGAVALGGAARAEYDGIALGYEAKARRIGSVALGAHSDANENNSVSVGNSSLKRRIINVADARLSTNSTDAVTGQQLYATNQNVITATNTANAAKTAADQALVNTRLVTQTSASSAVRVGGDNTGTQLDIRNKSNANRKLTGVADAALSATSTEAVTGKQLHATNTAVTTAQTTATAAKSAADTVAARVDAQALALGRSAVAGGSGTSASVALGNTSIAHDRDSVALGPKARAGVGADGENNGGVGATSVGSGAWSANAATAIGYRAKAVGGRSVAIGLDAMASDSYGVALGNEASSTHSGSVALGFRSQTTGMNQISVGNETLKRKIVNVNDGTLSATSSDAVTGKQLHATNTTLTSVSSTATAAKAAADNALGQVTTVAGLVGQVSATGNVRLGAQNTGTVLDVANKNGAARRISNVANATLSASSTDAVTGQQLHATNTAVTTAQSTATAAKTAADSALSQVGTVAGLVGQVSASGQVRLGAENTGTVLDVSNKNGARRRIQNIANGILGASSTDAVTGQQLFATNERVGATEVRNEAQDLQLVDHADRLADHRTDLDRLRADFDGFEPDLEGVVKFNADRTLVDLEGAVVKGVGPGDISSAASTDAVNGGQLFATNARIEQMEQGSRFLQVGYDEFSEDASAGWLGVAIGDSAESSPTGEGGTAVGSFSKALGVNSVALGRAAYVATEAEEGFALGASSRVETSGGVALGALAIVEATASNSVAIGYGSIATEDNTVSVGTNGGLRRIVNVARGRAGTDVATVSQVTDSLATLGGGADLDASGNIIAPTYAIQGSNHNTVGDALTALDGAVVVTDARVGSLEGKLRSVFQDTGIRADGLNQLTLSGAQGAVLTNLADGRIAAGSRDAVTGSQLHDAKQEIARNRSDLDALRDSHVTNNDLARLSAAEVGNVIDFGGATLTGVADGELSAGSKDVVNGRQLYATNQRMDGLEQGSRFMKVGYDDLSIDASAGWLGVAIGDSAESSPTGEGGTAVGSFSKALGTNSVALGRASWVVEGATEGFALGSSSHVQANGGVALGARAVVEASAEGAVALGHASIADEANTVSVGTKGRQRRIVNVANGRNAQDATTVAQLNATLATLGGGAHIDSNGNIIGPHFTVQGQQQSTLSDALQSLDGAVTTQGSRMDQVETQLRSVFQDTTTRSDGLNQLTLAGAQGMVISNVANGLVAAGSRDAVNGGQLHDVQQQLNGRMDGLEQRIDGQPQARVASTPEAPQPPAETPTVADTGKAPNATPETPKEPTPQVDTAELEKMLARANEYSDGISREVDARLDKMDKRFNRMAAMSSAQSAMAMNTAGLNTYNRLGAGVGYSDGESAMAVGYQRVLNEKGSATFSLNGAFTNSGERTMGVGLGIGW
ncbi:ESPR-type extended signal peptide-containing protein [Stenotrophomonas sp. SAU14A_NAIMI4_8]|uniref:ESPR-type extended signal peptide-containing protein n=1 Tax=Stenotrophomonas sp. SAU14A_NAIMI4_8 TaxID=2072409 RepID=UPI000D53D8B6|nr:ESPR-type extended signal peptide-containing protein [Stenotrophomonas sp. SAU14A_NAIMI4_8]AWH34271.1 hemagluttinin domain-containing protein [Stenotrophomonas sp. SAU14A_NAIMI4_8]